MKRTTEHIATASAALALSLLSAGRVFSSPTTVTHADIPDCDVLIVPTNVDELGRFVFPANELIAAQTLGQISYIACPADALPGNISTRVEITNLTGQQWTDVWYVGNPETTFTNTDGVVNGMHAFKIDSGIGQFNNSLIFESGPVDGIWQNGEIWEFVIDGYINTAGLQPHQFDQVGVPDVFPIPPIASANIIAVNVVPEPSSLALLTLGAIAPLRRRRSVR